MKKVILLSLILILVAMPGFAAAPEINSLTVDELLLLREQVNARLVELGQYPYIVIEKNDKGEEVTKLQERLAALGYYTSDITGKYDSNTISAYKAYEKASGLKQDGIPTVDEQKALFSDEAIAKPTPTPKPTPKPTATPKPTKTPDPRKAYGTFKFQDASRYPEDHKGTLVKITGTVVQVLGSRQEGFELRVATKGRYDNVVYIVVDNATENILDNDKINFYCVLDGTLTYKTVMGAEMTIPLLFCDFYEYR